MFDLFVASDLTRRLMADSLEPKPSKRRNPKPKPAAQSRRSPVRSTSAAALRRLAERLEPPAAA